jgi:hypothetical protein
MPFATTIAQVETAERYLGVRLPEVYRERLVAVNGGELSTGGEDWRVFPVLDITNHSTADHGTTDIVSETRHARTLEGFPEDAVAIASNRAGDLLVLLASGSPKRLDPQVQLWDRGTHQCKPVALRYEDK